MLVSSTTLNPARPPRRPDDRYAETKGPRMSIKDTIQDKTGIYRLGFNQYSFLGILLPLLFVAIVGGALAYIVTQM
jgi:hypothetical protein